MSLYKDLKVLSNAAFYDKCNSIDHTKDSILSGKNDDCIYHSKAGNKTIPLFKILLTNKCGNADNICPRFC